MVRGGGGGGGVGGGGRGWFGRAPPPPPLARFGAEQKNTFRNVFDHTYDIGDFRSHYASE